MPLGKDLQILPPLAGHNSQVGQGTRRWHGGAQGLIPPSQGPSHAPHSLGEDLQSNQQRQRGGLLPRPHSRAGSRSPAPARGQIYLGRDATGLRSTSQSLPQPELLFSFVLKGTTHSAQAADFRPNSMNQNPFHTSPRS